MSEANKEGPVEFAIATPVPPKLPGETEWPATGNMSAKGGEKTINIFDMWLVTHVVHETREIEGQSYRITREVAEYISEHPALWAAGAGRIIRFAIKIPPDIAEAVIARTEKKP